MRSFVLTNIQDKTTTILQWDQSTGQSAGNDDLLDILNFTIRSSIQQGYCGVNPTLNYPVKNPLHDPLEMAVILAFMDYQCDDLPMPKFEEIDPYARDKQGNIIGEIAF